MKKTIVLNLILFLIFASLFLVIYFSEEKNYELDKLSLIDTNNIHAITIQHNKNKTSLIKNTKNIWLMTHPIEISANDFRINSILKLINAPVHSKYSLSEINLSKIGLDETTTAVSFNKQQAIFGDINPATGLRFIRYNDAIYTIEDVYHPLLSSNFATLVSPGLLPNGSVIEKLILINQTINKDEKGRWRSNIKISADNINKTIDHWSHDQAFGVHSYLQRESLGEVFIYIKDQKQAITFTITDTDPWLILARPELNIEYHLDIEAYDKLIAPQ